MHTKLYLIILLATIYSISFSCKGMEEKKDEDALGNGLRLSVYRLLKRGAKIDINEHYGHIGITALIDAATHGDLNLVRYFIDNGAGINVPDRVGNTALTTALFNRQFDVALYLVKQGANRYTFDMYKNAANKELVFANLFRPNSEWPKELLVALQGECPICLDDIDEVGHIYKCGHSVHAACKVEKCPFCRE